MALLWNPVPIPVFDPGTGERAGGAKAYFYVGGTTTPLIVYTTDDATVPQTWPVEADANGVFPPIFVPYGPFGYRVITANGTMISPNVQLVQNPAPASSGGGGSVPDAELNKTGSTRWTFDPGQTAGYVRMNGRTIGSVGSGATERANDDTEDLYVWLYDRLPNSICPVSGGRGANAAADYAAGKTLQLPDMRGKAPFGLDTMGNSAANVLQVSTTITTTNASATATVASSTGLKVGMVVVSENIPAGTTISTIVGTTLTLSTGVGVVAGSGTPARFALFGDMQQTGNGGGEALHTLTAAELPANIPNSASSSSSTSTAAPPGFAVLLTQGNNMTVGAGGVTAPLPSGGVSGLTSTTSTSTSVTINAAGGAAHNIMPPFILVTWLIKL